MLGYLGRLLSTVVFSPPGLPIWASYLILVMKLTVIIILIRRNIAPSLLAKLSQRLRARSISMRSIRGLYLKSKDRTWRVERISWSLSVFSERHISIKVTGLSLELTPSPRDRRPSVSRRSPNASIQILKRFEAILKKIVAKIPSNLTQKVQLSLGSIHRRALVTLIQTMNFELDGVSISTSSFPGTEIIIGNVTFNSTIDFLRKEVYTPKFPGERSNKRFSMAVARDILTRREDVAGSLTIDISEITGKTSVIFQRSSKKRLSRQTAVNDGDVFFHVPGIVHFKVNFGYDPLAHELSPDSVIISIVIPRWDVSLDKINSILSPASEGFYEEESLPSEAKMSGSLKEDVYRRSHKPTRSINISALKSLNIQTECVNLFQTNPSQLVHLLTIEHLDLILWPSTGSSSPLHRKWLGAKDRGSTLGLTLRVDELKFYRWSPQSAGMTHCFMTIHRMDIYALFHRWPMNWTFMSSGSDTIDDPMVIWEIFLGDVLIVDQFSSFMPVSDVPRDNGPLQRTPKQYPETMFPKARFDLLCRTITVDTYDGDSPLSSEATYSLVTSDINVHADVAFNDFDPVDSSSIHTSRRSLELNSELSSGPVCVRSSLKESTLLGHDSLITIGQISGCLTGYIATSQRMSTESIVLHPEDSTVYLKVLLDSIIVDLWKKDNISLIRSLKRMLHPSSEAPKTPRGPLFNYAIHVGVHRATLAVTGLDINPTNDLGLSRGLEISSGWALQIVDFRRQVCNPRLPKGIVDEELNNDAQSAASENGNPRLSSNDFLLFSCVFQDFICSPIVASSSEYGPIRCSPDDTFCTLLKVPRLRLNAFFMDHSVKLKAVNYRTTICSYVDLLGIYSVLLVSQTFKQCFESEINNNNDQLSPSTAVAFKLQLHALDIKCNLPLAQEVFLRIEEISLENSSTLLLGMSAASVNGYVPNSKELKSWDPLLKLSNTTFQVLRSTNQSLIVMVHGLRFSVPHGFIFSELLVNLTIAIKALRHLWSIVQKGHHISFPTPSAEAAKTLPDIGVCIKSLVVEAMDNPFDGRIARISRIGPMAQRQRLEREQAFKAKVRNLRMEDETESDVDGDLQNEYPYKFTSKRTVSISDAHDRLNKVHALSWFKAISREERRILLLEGSVLDMLGQSISSTLPILVCPPDKLPPLFRAVINGFNLRLSPLSKGNIPFELGNMPKSTQYTLFVPFHMKCVLDGARIFIRDYPLPLFNLPVASESSGLEIESDIVIAEELGLPESVEWFACPIIPNQLNITGYNGYSLDVPKTIMPVKSYADLQLKFHSAVTEFTWGISYSPAIQDILRIVETLTPTSVDPSPVIGFWDKLRLVLHWRITAMFDGTACLHFKGSHDPYRLSGLSTGFDFKWDQNVVLRINHKNAERELIQLTSDSMAIMIPCSKSLLSLHKTLQNDISAQWDPSISWCLDDYEKLCAEFSNGIKWGIGFVLERTCNPNSCQSCHGDPFNRSCRFFTFSPHHEVILRKQKSITQDPIDSYYGFRSNFIHLSTSLVSPLKIVSTNVKNAFHLTPKTFTHFWSWWSLFDDGISLPIRQGRIFPDFRPPTQKFSQHLATVKYRIEFSSIYIAHTYKLDTIEDWKQGMTRCIGIKASLDSFQADLHQRLEEKPRSQSQKQKSKVVRHRPFYAIDVILTGLDLRSLMAKFLDPDKQLVDPDFAANSTNFWEGFTPCSPSSDWIDLDDFKETDWEIPEAESTFYLYQTASCPRFVYFKRVPMDLAMNSNSVKFGDEATHVCLMGKEPSIQEVQLQFGIKRLLDLRMQMVAREQNAGSNNMSDGVEEQNARQMISLLEEYIQHSSVTLNRAPKHSTSYIPANIVLPEELRNFVNVYQVHCPVIHLNNATRDILREYYTASRDRRGFEYHLSARAVKFIRDQELVLSTTGPNDTIVNRRPRSGSAHIAAKAVKRMLTREGREGPDDLKESEGLLGWEPGISERKAHLCLLIKPQIVLQSNHPEDSTLLLAADHVVLRNHGIVDDANIDDPISGHIMQRNFATINGLQMFQPLNPALTANLPFEVFLDVRCESSEFKRIVPQTHATLRYDSFNKLRLRNNVTTLSSTLKENPGTMDHLLYEMDLLGIEVPRFSVAADASAFSAMSNIVNDLLLFSDPARKARSLQLENMIFGYDFTNYRSAAKVVSDLQSRLRWRLLLDEFYMTRDYISIPSKNILENKAYILKLSEELNMIFDAFKLAQINTDDRGHDQKSALRLHTSSSEISWRMLGANRELLAKLAVRGIGFSWLRRRDSSTTSVLQVEDLQAFDGSANALWPEILTKYNEPANHYMVKRGLFMKGQWTVLAPVGGISIYSDFKIELHPIRLTLETQLGNKILAYILPNRREKDEIEGSFRDHNSDKATTDFSISSTQSRRRLLTSRSMSNLTLINSESETNYHAPGLPKSRSSAALVLIKNSNSDGEDYNVSTSNIARDEDGDVYQMRYRSNQKTFVHAEIPSVHVLLSVVKGRGFLIRDARLRTHDLEWRNRTSSLEELIENFVPSDPSWRGWVKVAWQQPIFSVGNVVKELVTKTQWGRIGKHAEEDESKSNPKSSEKLVPNAN